jgi:hypothetical protein
MNSRLMWSSGFVFLIFILFSFYVSTRDRTLFDIKLQNAKRDEKALNDANITPTSPEWVDMIYSFCDKAKKLNEDGMSARPLIRNTVSKHKGPHTLRLEVDAITDGIIAEFNEYCPGRY